jgi:exopolysaccharide biosynthesis polyprenyl glycosylphosphotransferase
VRRHALRAAARLAALLTIDLTVFWVLRGGIRLIRDRVYFGTSLADAVAAFFPKGLLGGYAFPAAMLAGLLLAGTYGRGDLRRNPGRIAKGILLAVVLALWGPLWTSDWLHVVAQAVVILAVLAAGVTAARLTFDGTLRFVFQTPADGDPMIFVGDRADGDARMVHDMLLGRHRMRHSRWVNLPCSAVPDAAIVTAALALLQDALSEENADTLVLCGEIAPALFETIVEVGIASGIRVLAVPRVSGVVQRRADLVWYDGHPFVELTVPAFRGWQLVLKRATDLIGAIIGLIVLSPLFAAVAIAIRVTSAGPVLFSQERVGYAGRVFRLLKFRTMRTDAEAMKATLGHLNVSGDPRLFKIPDDPRVTAVGRFLRKWSLDELPQLWNVLLGEMSLVGPRPFFESDLTDYLDHHFARLGAKPGITGLWQVEGRSAVTDFEEVVRMDRAYIERWSVLLDSWILLRTIPAVLRGRGAF